MTGFAEYPLSPDAGKTIGPHYFRSPLILKSKQAKIFYKESLRNLLSLLIPVNFWRPLFPRYSLSIKRQPLFDALRPAVFCFLHGKHPYFP